MVGRVELAQLFRTCDRQQVSAYLFYTFYICSICLFLNLQRGYIDRQEFSELCANFQIQKEDAGTIFEDLDRDQDRKSVV